VAKFFLGGKPGSLIPLIFENKDMACRSMLRKLEQRRLIVLPAPRVSGNRARRIREMAHCSDPIVCSLEQLQK
jgi:hypothetical protein